MILTFFIRAPENSRIFSGSMNLRIRFPGRSVNFSRKKRMGSSGGNPIISRRRRIASSSSSSPLPFSPVLSSRREGGGREKEIFGRSNVIARIGGFSPGALRDFRAFPSGDGAPSETVSVGQSATGERDRYPEGKSGVGNFPGEGFPARCVCVYFRKCKSEALAKSEPRG